MRFELIYRIDSPSLFGLPQDGLTVLPAKPQQIFGPTMHRASGTLVSPGPLSVYRSDDNALSIAVTCGDIDLRFLDNFIFVKTEAPGPNEASNKVSDTLEKLLQHMTVTMGRIFTYELLIIEGEDEKLYPIPKVVPMFTVTHYNLVRLKEAIEETEALCEISDARLDRALEYYELALLLYEKRSEIADPRSRHFKRLLSAIFLNLWKAASVIVGDPSKDSDYQRRYKQLGFDYNFFKAKIELIRGLRNDYDIAHYSLNEESLEEIERKFKEANKAVVEIINRYRVSLA